MIEIQSFKVNRAVRDSRNSILSHCCIRNT